MAQTISYEVRLALVLGRILIVFKSLNLFTLSLGGEASMVLFLAAPIAGV